jgi:hypothetical protein
MVIDSRNRLNTALLHSRQRLIQPHDSPAPIAARCNRTAIPCAPSVCLQTAPNLEIRANKACGNFPRRRNFRPSRLWSIVPVPSYCSTILQRSTRGSGTWQPVIPSRRADGERPRFFSRGRSGTTPRNTSGAARVARARTSSSIQRCVERVPIGSQPSAPWSPHLRCADLASAGIDGRSSGEARPTKARLRREYRAAAGAS